MGWFSNPFKKVGNFFSDTFDSITDLFEGAGGWFGRGIKGILEGSIKGSLNIGEGLVDLTGDVISPVTSIFKPPEIPGAVKKAAKLEAESIKTAMAKEQQLLDEEQRLYEERQAKLRSGQTGRRGLMTGGYTGYQGLGGRSMLG